MPEGENLRREFAALPNGRPEGDHRGDEQREPLRRVWVQQMTAKGLLAGLSREEAETESITIYNTCVGCLATGQYESAQMYATNMAERGVLRGMTTEQIIGGLLTLRDVSGRTHNMNQHPPRTTSSRRDTDSGRAVPRISPRARGRMTVRMQPRIILADHRPSPIFIVPPS